MLLEVAGHNKKSAKLPALFEMQNNSNIAWLNACTN
jgi:hypothetical protein